jgi:hypothetical protein
VQTVVHLLQAPRKGCDQLHLQMKLRATVVKELLANLKIRKGETHVGDWLTAARRATARLRVFAEINHMDSALGDAQLYDQFLQLSPRLSNLV